MNNKEIKNMTRGAAIAAFYIILIALFRFTNETDLIFLIFPLPLLIYYRVSSFKWCLLVEAVVLVISFFVVGNIYNYVGVVLVNVLASVVFVYALNNINNKVIDFIIIYITYIFLEFFVLFFTNYFVFGIDINTYIEQTIVEFSTIFSFLNETILKRCVYIALPVSLIIYALLRIAINYLLYNLVGIRLGVVNKEEFKFKILYSKFFILIYSFIVVLSFVSSYFFLNNFNLFSSITYGFVISVLFIMSIYLIIQGSLFLKYIFLDLNQGVLMIFVLLSIIIFPIGIILGIISNFKMR